MLVVVQCKGAPDGFLWCSVPVFVMLVVVLGRVVPDGFL